MLVERQYDTKIKFSKTYLQIQLNQRQILKESFMEITQVILKFTQKQKETRKDNFEKEEQN